jgi:hypothetical protein
MDRIFQKILDGNFSDLTGLTVDASVPVPESLINEIISSTLEGNREISDCRVTVHEHNRMTVDVKSPRWPWPLHFKLKLFGSVDLSHSPTVRAFLNSNVLLGRLGSMFKMLPPGIMVYEDQVSVDTGAFLNLPDQKQLFELLKTVEIRTEEGRLILDIKIEK